jgi:hypothetical protein
MDLYEHFFSVISALQKEKVEYVLIGGFAVVLHGFPRATQDIDLFLKPTEENITKLKKALQQVFDDPAIHDISLDELKKYPVIRYGTPDGFSIDLIVNIGEMFSYDDIQFEVRNIDDQPMRIATPRSLLEMKKNTYREIDQLDVKFLMEKIENEDRDGN